MFVLIRNRIYFGKDVLFVASIGYEKIHLSNYTEINHLRAFLNNIKHLGFQCFI